MPIFVSLYVYRISTGGEVFPRVAGQQHDVHRRQSEKIRAHIDHYIWTIHVLYIHSPRVKGLTPKRIGPIRAHFQGNQGAHHIHIRYCTHMIDIGRYRCIHMKRERGKYIYKS